MTYGFRCGSCGYEFELTATVAEYEALRSPRCPACGAGGARRVFTPVLVMTASRSGGAEPSSGGCCGGACGCRH